MGRKAAGSIVQTYNITVFTMGRSVILLPLPDNIYIYRERKDVYYTTNI